MSEGKTISQRLVESKNIHLQLQNIGALMLDKNRLILKNAMNDFVSDGVSKSFKLSIGNTSKAIVILSNSVGVQSGITLERL